MNTFPCFAVIAVLLSQPTHADSVYKCTQPNKSVMFTDGKCPAHSQETLIHEETAAEIERRQQAEKIATIKRFIANNQPDTAKEFALKNNLSETYKAQLALFLNQKKVEAQQQAAEERQQQQQQQQQQILLQQQALVLQKQQLLAIEKLQSQQQATNNSSFYGYGYGYLPRTHFHRHSCQPTSLGGCVPNTPTPHDRPFFSGGMNSLPSFPSQMNPPQSLPSQMNPPQTAPTLNRVLRK